MAEAKPFASLSSGLLARKGAARPAMRPQGFGQAGASLEDLGWNDMGFESPKPVLAPRDAGHDAFGEEVIEHPRVHPTGLTPVQSPVHHQQAEIAGRLHEPEEEELDESAELDEPQEAQVEAPVVAPEPAFVRVDPPASVVPFKAVGATPVRAPRTRAAAGAKAKAAFTLRLDKDRHLRLRLACAVDGRSAQQFVTAALDQMLAQMPELEALAAKAARKE